MDTTNKAIIEVLDDALTAIQWLERRVHRSYKDEGGNVACVQDVLIDLALLSEALESVQPPVSQPVTDEREAFEAWYFPYAAEAEREYGGLDCTNPKGIAEDAWQARAALAAQASGQDREDAERYRFIRDGEQDVWCSSGDDLLSGSLLDATIDAARAAAKEQS